MGNDNSEGYNREERIKKEEAKCKRLGKDIDDMWKDPMFSVEECVNAGKVYSEMTDRLNSLKEMNKSEKKFSEKINLNDYRNNDGTFNIYKTERPLNTKNGEKSYKLSKGAHHEGIAIGNGKKMLFSDYGVKDNTNLAVRFWDSKEKIEKWEKIEQIGKSNSSNEDVKKIFFGKKSENWINPNDYNLCCHNCKDYSKEKIEELKKNDSK